VDFQKIFVLNKTVHPLLFKASGFFVQTLFIFITGWMLIHQAPAISEKSSILIEPLFSFTIGYENLKDFS